MHDASGDDLIGLVKVVRRRWTVARAMWAIARAATSTLLVVALLLGVDRLFTPSDLAMIGLAALALGGVAVLIARALWPLCTVPTGRQVARFIEERCPELDDRVATATDLEASRSPLYAAVMADAARWAREVDPARVIETRDVRRAVASGVGSTIALVTLLTLGLTVVERVARSALLYAFPSSASLAVEPGDVRLVVGAPLDIRARLTDTAGAPARSLPRVRVVAADGASDTLEMRPTRDGYVVTIPSVTTSFTYRVTAATLASEDFSVTALRPPRVDRIEVAYDYPAYTGLARRVERDGGDIYAPVGTRVTLTVHTDEGVRAASLRLAEGGTVSMQSREPTAFTAAFDVRAADRYGVSLIDVDGLSNDDGVSYRVRIIRDRPPQVVISRPGGDRDITPLEEVVIEARAEDDFWVEQFELVYTVMGRAERTVALLAEPTMNAVGIETMYAEDLDVSPGDFISYHVRARNTDPRRGANWTRSDIYFLEVRPFEREFEEAASQAAVGMDASAVGNLVDIQKDIIAATWRLDRQPAGGRRSSDIVTVADAQADLRRNVSRVAIQVRARGRGVGGSSASGSTESDALASVLVSMASAEAALRGGTTAEALPHEMAALEQLLRAQTEIRRHQVSFSHSGQGQSAGTRAREDLSSLFDRDLRREQETNYEQRRSPPTTEDPESDALQKVRELAARQEALTDAQDELSRRRDRAQDEDEDEDDEVTRTLERLSRDQRDIAEQMSELEQALRDGGAAGGGGRSTPASASSSSSSERPSDRMRQASEALQRGDAAAAAARGREATDRLRALERRLTGQSAGERQRALGALQLEAGQIADAQRQIERRLGSNANGRGARRRLADQEDDVADRVDALRRRLDDLVPDASDAEREALVAASDDLDAASVADRLRERAQALRAAADNALGAADASDLTSVLDRVAERLRSAAVSASTDVGDHDAERRRLSADLEAAQDLRRNLAAIERQLQAVGNGNRAGASPRETGAGSIGASAADLLGRLEASPELAAALEAARPGAVRDLARWAEHRFSRGAPGAEAFKQDYAAWDRLRDDVADAIEKFEAARTDALRAAEADGQAHVGAAGDVPESYQPLVEQYYRALADRPAQR